MGGRKRIQHSQSHNNEKNQKQAKHEEEEEEIKKKKMKEKGTSLSDLFNLPKRTISFDVCKAKIWF